MGLFRPQTEGEAQASAAAQALQADELARQNQNGTGIQQELTPAGPPRPPAFDPGPDLRGTVPPFHPGVDPDTTMAESIYGEEAAQDKAASTAFPYMQQGGARGPQDVVQEEGANYLPTGGKEEFEQTYREGPKRLAAAQADVGRLSANRSEAMGEQYRQSAQQAQEAMAANKSRRADDDQQIAIRQQQLDQAVTHYSNGLADQGKFWSSPGNIVSAIAFSLMPIFSNDPTIGVKLINQAIDRDMSNRKDLANMHLGELRSNLGNYRKIAEDHNVGDQIAQSEAHRLTAMEIERISNTFDSPIVKAKAKAMIEDQLMRAGQTRQTAYNHFNYNTVRRLDPRVDKAFKAPGLAGNDDAWHSFTLPQGAGGNVVGNVQGTQSVAKDTTGSAPGGALSRMQPTQVVALASSPEQILKLADSGQLGGKDLAVMARNSIVMRAKALAGNPADPNYPTKFNKIVDDMRTKAETGVAAIAKAAQPQARGYAITQRLSGDMATIEAECKQAGVTPEEFLGDLRKGFSGATAAKINDLRIKLNNNSTDSASQALAMRRLEASERFHQVLAQKVIEFRHTNFGGAQSESEIASAKQAIDTNSSWEKIKNFVRTEGEQYAAEHKAALNQGGNPYSKMLYLSDTSNNLVTLPHHGIVAPTTRSGTTVRGKNAPGPAPTKDEFVP